MYFANVWIFERVNSLKCQSILLTVGPVFTTHPMNQEEVINNSFTLQCKALFVYLRIFSHCSIKVSQFFHVKHVKLQLFNFYKINPAPLC